MTSRSAPTSAGEDSGAITPSGASPQELLPVVYAELRRLAQRCLAHEAPGLTVAATELVHEAFLRIVGDRPAGWASRRQFFAAAAEAIRRILVERARARSRLRRGGGRKRVSLSLIDIAEERDLDEVLALDEAFEHLETVDARAADVVRMRFWAGLSEQETAAVLGVTTRTVRRDWSYARAFLFDTLRDRERTG